MRRRDWNEISRLDALWAILSDPAKRHGGGELEDFFATGREEVAGLLVRARTWSVPAKRERALDYGTGVGRIARALAAEFDEVLGVDISDEMIMRARELNAQAPNAQFDVTDGAGLRTLDSGRFDLIYSRLVLQHVTDRAVTEQLIADLVRLLADGGLLAFQLPSRIPLRRRLQPRPRAYAALRRLRMPATFLYRTLGLAPIRMNAVPEGRVLAVLGAAGGTVIAVDRYVIPETRIEDRTYFVTIDRSRSLETRAPARGSAGEVQIDTSMEVGAAVPGERRRTGEASGPQ